MNPILPISRVSPEYVLAGQVNSELLPLLRNLYATIVAQGELWEANGIMPALAAAEAEAENPNAATLGGYTTNDWRVWHAIFVEVMTRLGTPITYTKADGTNDVIAPKAAILRYYQPST